MHGVVLYVHRWCNLNTINSLCCDWFCNDLSNILTKYMLYSHCYITQHGIHVPYVSVRNKNKRFMYSLAIVNNTGMIIFIIIIIATACAISICYSHYNHLHFKTLRVSFYSTLQTCPTKSLGILTMKRSRKVIMMIKKKCLKCQSLILALFRNHIFTLIILKWEHIMLCIHFQCTAGYYTFTIISISHVS